MLNSARYGAGMIQSPGNSIVTVFAMAIRLVKSSFSPIASHAIHQRISSCGKEAHEHICDALHGLSGRAGRTSSFRCPPSSMQYAPSNTRRTGLEVPTKSFLRRFCIITGLLKQWAPFKDPGAIMCIHQQPTTSQPAANGAKPRSLVA